MSLAMDPESFQDATSRPDADLWMAAMKDEMESLKKSETWSLVEKPVGCNIVSNKWVFKSKMKPDGTLERRKARGTRVQSKRRSGFLRNLLTSRAVRVRTLSAFTGCCC
jgi:hypothetical protein